MGPVTTVEPVSEMMVRSRVLSLRHPWPNLSLLQRRGPSPGLESLLLGESASHEIYLHGGNKTYLNTGKARFATLPVCWPQSVYVRG